MSPSDALNDAKHRAVRIWTYHQGRTVAFGQQMGYAFLAGLELNQVKAQLPHGEFQPWWKKHLAELPERSGQRYMAFATALIEQNRHVADLATKPLLLAGGILDKKEEKAIVEAVYEASDSKSLTEFYRDLGLIRPPQKPKYHPRTGTGKSGEGDKARRQELFKMILGGIRTITPKFLMHLTDAQKAELLDAGIEMNNVIRACTGKKGKT